MAKLNVNVAGWRLWAEFKEFFWQLLGVLSALFHYLHIVLEHVQGLFGDRGLVEQFDAPMRPRINVYLPPPALPGHMKATNLPPPKKEAPPPPTSIPTSSWLPYNCNLGMRSRWGWYAVARGAAGPAIYPTWEEAKRQVDGFPNNKHKKTPTWPEAKLWVFRELAQSGEQVGSTHRQNLEFQGTDQAGHDVFKCLCGCNETFCTNGLA